MLFSYSNKQTNKQNHFSNPSLDAKVFKYVSIIWLAFSSVVWEAFYLVFLKLSFNFSHVLHLQERVSIELSI